MADLTRDQIILILFILMAIVLTLQLIYILLRKMKSKKEAKMLRKQPDRTVETMAERAHNTIASTESVSATLAMQGVDTSEADTMIQGAKRDFSARNYASAIQQAEDAKLVLLRAKRGHDTGPAPVAPGEESHPPVREEKSLDSLPTNYVQAKFMIATVKDLLEQRGITSGDAHVFYIGALELFEREDYTGALSRGIKAEKLLGSGSLSLIGEEKIAQAPDGEVYVCPGCDSEVGRDDAFCRECGQNLEAAMDCPKCGSEYEANDKFCRKCGRKLQ